jgi:RNA polymerase sigma factor (sigma-70 family)
MIIPPIFPSAGFIRNASPEEEARAQEIVNQFLAQISPHAATASIAPSKCASNINTTQRHQNSAKFFSATITVKPNGAFKGDRCCRIESVTSMLEKYVQKSRRFNTTSEELLQKQTDKMKADDYFDGDEIQFKLHQSISLLPEKQQLVFKMKYFQELKYEEMSEILDTSVGALKASYHHAVKKIENYMNTH